MSFRSSNAERLANWLVDFRWTLLGIGLVLGLVGFFVGSRLDFDRSIESMFASDSPVLHSYQELKEKFGGNEIVLAVYEDSDLFNPDGSGIRRLERVAERLKKVPGVQDVLSLSQINKALGLLYSPQKMLRVLAEKQRAESDRGNAVSSEKEDSRPNDDGVGNRDEALPIVDPDDSLAREFLKIFEGYTHSPDGQIVSIACMLDDKSKSHVSRRAIIESLRSIIEEYPDGQVTGEPVMVVDGFQYVQRDGRRLGLNSAILVSLVILLCFRSLRWIVIPLAVMQLTLVLTRASLVLLGLQLTMVSSMLTAIVVVISVATVVHLILRYREARLERNTQEASIRYALRLLVFPIIWACLTDAVGFASLTVSDVGPVRDFGLMMTVASVLVLGSILLLVPGLSLLGSIDADPKDAWGEGNLRTALTLTTKLIERRPGLWALLIFFSSALVASGMFFLKVETDFTKNFRPGTPIYRSYEFVETRFGGAGVLDVIIPIQGKLTKNTLRQAELMQEELLELELIGEAEPTPALYSAISLADADRAARKFPASKVVPLSARLYGMSAIMPSFMNAMYTPEEDENGYRYFRMMLRTSQRQRAEQKQWLVEKIQSAANRYFPPQNESVPQAQTTGFFVLLADLVNSVLTDQKLMLIVASLGICLMMSIAFRSVTLAFVALVPNLLPLVVVLGALGWLGVRINMGAAMIAAVSIGLSIDSSIHYIWSFQRWRDAGHDFRQSIQHAEQRAGRAVVFSTLALVAGFSTLCLSEFVPTIYFGGLASLTMLGGLFGNLVILPILLNLIYAPGRTRNPTSDSP